MMRCCYTLIGYRVLSDGWLLEDGTGLEDSRREEGGQNTEQVAAVTRHHLALVLHAQVWRGIRDRREATCDRVQHVSHKQPCRDPALKQGALEASLLLNLWL